MIIMKFTTNILGLFIGYSLLSGSFILESSWFSFSKNFSDFVIIIFTLYSSVTFVQNAIKFIRGYLM